MGLLDSRFELVAHRLGLGPKLPERLVEPQDLGREIFQVGPLGREIGEAHADQGAQNQREKKADQPRNLADYSLRLACLVFLLELCLQSQPGVAGDHEQDENQYAGKKNAHFIYQPQPYLPAGAVPDLLRNIKQGRGAGSGAVLSNSSTQPFYNPQFVALNREMI